VPQDRAGVLLRQPFSVRGRAGWMERETADRRSIAAGALSGVATVPLMALYTRPWPGGHAGATLVGRVSVYPSGLDPLEVILSGTCDNIAPGRYPCGLDLARLDLAAWERDMDAALAEAPPVMRVTSAEVIGLTVYLPASGQTGAFPDAYVEVLR